MKTDEFLVDRKSNNEAAYSVFFDLEIIIREFLWLQLLSCYGQAWAKQGLPIDVRDEVKDGLKYERGIYWRKAILYQPLYYVSFPNLKKIIINGKNWTEMFAHIFGSGKPNLDASLSDLEPIRNAIAHNRFIADLDLSILIAVRDKLFAAIPSAELEKAKSNALTRIPITDHLRSMLEIIVGSKEAMADGLPIPDGIIHATKWAKEWWFNELYLSADLEPVRKFIAVSEGYKKFYSGFGQAPRRRAWLIENSAEGSASAAEAAMNKILEEGGKYAAEPSSAE